jgi:hypothetical protein
MGRDHLEDSGVNVNLKERGCEGVKWIQLAQDGVQQWALMNTVMNFREQQGISSLGECLAIFLTTILHHGITSLVSYLVN